MAEASKNPRKKGEESFSLMETILALGMMVTILLHVSQIQTSSLIFSDYGRHSTQATWLAKAVMAEIEYKWRFFPLKEVKSDSSSREVEFSEELCPRTPECPYRFSVEIDEFKLPILDILTGASGGGEGEEEGGDGGGFMAIVKTQIKEILGDELLKFAKVSVTWPSGSRKESVDLVYLMTAQNALDEFIENIPLKKTKVDPASKAKTPATPTTPATQ